MAKSKEGSTEGTVQVTLPEGMTQEDLAKALTSYAKKDKKSQAKDDSIVFKTIERGPEKEIRISRDTYKGRTYNSIREWYQDEDSPTKKPGRGVTFVYENIDEIIDGLNLLKAYLEDHPQEED